MRQHLILVGLPGAGKSTVGRLVARQLRCDFTDVDTVVEERMGRSVSQIFQELGEASFRVQERDLMREILRKAAGVIAPGGGWAAVPGNRDGAKTGSVLAYLSVTPEIAAARLAADHSRPLLTGKDLLQELRHLLNEREASYRTAEIVVDAERGSPEIVAEAVVAALRCYADSVE